MSEFPLFSGEDRAIAVAESGRLPPMPTLKPRDYQLDSIVGIFRAFEEYDSTLLILPTGTGKSEVCGFLLNEMRHFEVAGTGRLTTDIKRADWMGGRVLFLAHRDELILQAKAAIEAAIPGEDVGVDKSTERPDLSWSGHRIVVGSVQTVCQPRRLGKYDFGQFGLVVIDECFPAGTDVCGKKIEDIRPGDSVKSFNHSTGKIENRAVARIFSSNPSGLVRITFSSGNSVVCTPGHPFFLPEAGRYVPAILLDSNAMVLTNIALQVPNENREEELLLVQKGICSQTQMADSSASILLLDGVYEGKEIEGLFGNHDQDKSEVCVRAVGSNAKKKSHAQKRCSRQGVLEFADNGVETSCSRWQWTRHDCSRATSVFSLGMVSGGCENWALPGWQRLSALLQIRYRMPRPENRYRDRWAESLFIAGSSSGQKEGKFFGFDWVVSVKVLEPGDRGEFGGLCPGGQVYNLEVEGNHNYFANGILVHNCHHATPRSKTYWNIIQAVRGKGCKLAGFSATPDRLDEESLGQAFESVAFEYMIFDPTGRQRNAVDDGWLVRPIQQAIYVDSLDLSKIKVSKDGDFDLKELETVLTEEKPLQKMVSPLVELANYNGERRPTLVFTAGIEQAKEVCSIINRHARKHAEDNSKPYEPWAVYLTGKDDVVTVRRPVVQDFRDGKVQFMINCDLYTEGTDFPFVRVVGMMAPTASRMRYAQRAGRGLRPRKEIACLLNDAPDAAARRQIIANDIKKSCLICDFVGQAGAHKLIYSGDILGGNCTDEVVALAMSRVRKKGRADMAAELKLAQEEIDRRKQERRRQLIMEAKFRVVDIDPFDTMDVKPGREPGWFKGKRPTDRQKEVLENNGISVPKDMTFWQASSLIDELMVRRERGECTYKQAKLLMKYALDPKGVTFEVAKQIIDKIKANKWMLPGNDPQIEALFQKE